MTRRSRGRRRVRRLSGSRLGISCAASPSCVGTERRSLEGSNENATRRRRQPPASDWPGGFPGVKSTISLGKPRSGRLFPRGTSTAGVSGEKRRRRKGELKLQSECYRHKGRKNWIRWWSYWWWVRLDLGDGGDKEKGGGERRRRMWLLCGIMNGGVGLLKGEGAAGGLSWRI